MDNFKIMWMPTYACNIKCPQCAARVLPCFSEPELDPKFWIDMFKKVPYSIAQLQITGREPFMYKGIMEVIESVNCEIFIESNLQLNISNIITKNPNQKVIIHGTLHFPPGTIEYGKFLENLKYLKQFSNIDLSLQKYDGQASRVDFEKNRVILKSDFNELGINIRFSPCFDDTHLFSSYFIYSGSISGCFEGNNRVVITPAGNAYRCTGHLYQDINCLGNLNKNTWNEILLEKPDACKYASCTCGFRPQYRNYDEKITRLSVKKKSYISKIRRLGSADSYFIPKDDMRKLDPELWK